MAFRQSSPDDTTFRQCFNIFMKAFNITKNTVSKIYTRVIDKMAITLGNSWYYSNFWSETSW